ncbi:hypothetical protein [Paenibacillus ferrarius]
MSIKPAKKQEISSSLPDYDEIPAKKQASGGSAPFWQRFGLKSCFIAGIL